ncbi:MAG: DUF6279 family lipoprotein [Steroidobacteraceae bacterium]
MLLLAGCGTQFLYNRLDTLLYLYVSTQVSLHDAQAVGLRRELREFLHWHRRAELPRYAGFLTRLADEAQAGPLPAARIDRARLEIEDLWRESVARGAPRAALWLASLDARQRGELFASLAEEDDELREELCDAPEAQRRRERQKTFIDAVEDWTGALDAAQRQLVAERLQRLPASNCGWVASRARVREALRELIASGAGQPDYAARVTALLARPEDQWDPQYRAGFERTRDLVVGLLAELDATLAPRQRARLVAKLRGYARDFSELAAAGGTATTAR